MSPHIFDRAAITMNNCPSDNIDIWENEYKAGRSYLSYPDDAFLKLFFTYRPQGCPLSVLDFGAGSGPVSEFLLQHHCKVYSCDASHTAREMLSKRLSTGNATVISDQQIETIPNESLDIIVAWHVLYYLEPAELERMVTLFSRKPKPQSILIATMLGENYLNIKKFTAYKSASTTSF